MSMEQFANKQTVMDMETVDNVASYQNINRNVSNSQWIYDKLYKLNKHQEQQP